MKKILTIAAVMVFLSGCTDKNTANKTLESAGFIAINPQGKVVEGTVCSGVFKGATIRF